MFLRWDYLHRKGFHRAEGKENQFLFSSKKGFSFIKRRFVLVLKQKKGDSWFIFVWVFSGQPQELIFVLNQRNHFDRKKTWTRLQQREKNQVEHKELIFCVIKKKRMRLLWGGHWYCVPILCLIFKIHKIIHNTKMRKIAIHKIMCLLICTMSLWLFFEVLAKVKAFVVWASNFEGTFITRSLLF